eukprot:TRINITY_DN20009_c0_g2_i1.p1 TRINITY_DN20009_c0_g2~~TRINITY_DN20009_c0_g2_i1.p1  ORF type:complete len:221 (+),score=27.30 TRINITY_DN20009_c0_g2_i1:55-663(+)
MKVSIVQQTYFFKHQFNRKSQVRTTPITICKRNVVRTNAEQTQNYSSSSEEAKSVLDSFFLGRAVAQTLNERLVDFLADVIADIEKAQAEREQNIQELQARLQSEGISGLTNEVSQQINNFGGRVQKVFEGIEEEVRERAQVDLLKSQGISTDQAMSAVGIGQATESAPEVDVQEVIDELRAEIASTRADIQMYKNIQKQNE